MKTAFFLAMMAVSIGAAVDPALARSESSPLAAPSFATVRGAPLEHAQTATQRFAAIAMRWIVAENAAQAADQSNG